ncbi:MAG TPA: NAD(P)/FAD-dependent oxidoreductase, partial [Nocardioidaceae bacterium]
MPFLRKSEFTMARRTSTSATYDVVVVGARPAGAATALLLSRAGLRVLVVDRDRHGADTVSTHALLRGGVLQLARWGVLGRVEAAGTPPVRGCVFHFGADQIEIPVKPAAGVPALYAPRRTVLDAILVDAAKDAGAEVRFGIAVTDLRRDRQGRVTGVAGRDERGTAFEARARIVVGADGIGSIIARRSGAPVERKGNSACAFIYGYWDGLPIVDYELCYQPGIAAGFFPTNDRQTCVFVGTTPQRYRRETKAAGVAVTYARLLDEAAPGA